MKMQQDSIEVEEEAKILSNFEVGNKNFRKQVREKQLSIGGGGNI